MCGCVCRQAYVRVYEVACENKQSEACCRLGARLEPVIDHPSVANTQINVVEVVAVRLPLVLRPPLLRPSASRNLLTPPILASPHATFMTC